MIHETRLLTFAPSCTNFQFDYFLVSLQVIYGLIVGNEQFGYYSRVMKQIRPFGWLIIAFNIYFLYAFAKGVIELGSDDLAVGVYAFMSLIVWGVINSILYVLYRVTNRNKGRSCPACASKVKVGLTACTKCGFDFKKAASGESPIEQTSAEATTQSPTATPAKIDVKKTAIGLGVIAVIVAFSFFSNGNESNNDSYWCPTNPKIPAFSSECSSTTTDTNSAADTSWKPKNFEIWYEDSNVAYRWLKGSEFTCDYGDACWGMMVISKTGCPNGLYVELSLLDSNDVQVGYTNESLSSALPLQKSKLVFNAYEESAETGRISKISCY